MRLLNVLRLKQGKNVLPTGEHTSIDDLALAADSQVPALPIDKVEDCRFFLRKMNDVARRF